MGLPVFRESVAEEPRVKTDPSSSARSTIRRSRSNRQQRAGNRIHASIPASTSPSLSSAEISAAYFTRLVSDYESGAPPRARDGPVAADASSREVRSRGAVDATPEAIIALADRAHQEASNRGRIENDRALLRDALSYEVPAQTSLGSPHPDSIATSAVLPPVPESQDYALRRDAFIRTVTARWGVLNEPGENINHVISPVDERELRMTVSRGTPSALGSASYTPGFAPAHMPSDSSHQSRRPDRRRHRGQTSRPRSVDGVVESDERAVMDLPRLRRMGRRSIADARQLAARASRLRNQAQAQAQAGRVDGLGDRQRSISPDDTWETLLSTITPDRQLPSAHSSMTSATASAPASAASSLSSHGNSATTSITAPDEAESMHFCEYLSSDTDDYEFGLGDFDSEGGEEASGDGSDSDAGTVHMGESNRAAVRQRLREAARPRRRYVRNRRGSTERSSRAAQGVFSVRYEEAHDDNNGDRTRTSAQGPPGADMDAPAEMRLAEIQRTMDRLSRREEVQDDRLASAGLSHNLQALAVRLDRLERLEWLERERL
ncbi:MAG: hypothetical protein M1825_003316 [Sarcosagium campestre]|nr:MAG: hypothetical protein M1825_003316 [Sarcosagium campestre]